MTGELDRLVRRRAADRCEYCRMPEWLFGGVPFHIEHIIARKHGGPTDQANLALSCPHCNAYKGTDVASINPSTGRNIRLFHPRRDEWDEHFALEDARIIGRTDRGRVTVALLQMNHERMVAVRRELIDEGIYLDPSDAG